MGFGFRFQRDVTPTSDNCLCGVSFSEKLYHTGSVDQQSETAPTNYIKSAQVCKLARRPKLGQQTVLDLSRSPGYIELFKEPATTVSKQH